MKRTCVLAIAVLAGCATRPSQIEPIPFSDAVYMESSCQLLAARDAEIASRLQVIEPLQARRATDDAVIMVAVGVPVSVFDKAGNYENEIGRLRGEREAIDRQRQRRC